MLTLRKDKLSIGTRWIFGDESTNYPFSLELWCFYNSHMQELDIPYLFLPRPFLIRVILGTTGLDACLDHDMVVPAQAG
jgi:hypothetical protein